MGDIVEFGKKNEEPTITGEARCLCCNHEWTQTALVGSQYLDCPQCKSTKGLFKHWCDRPKEQHWQCNCGSFLFSVTKNGIYCIACANWTKPYDA